MNKIISFTDFKKRVKENNSTTITFDQEMAMSIVEEFDNAYKRISALEANQSAILRILKTLNNK